MSEDVSTTDTPSNRLSGLANKIALAAIGVLSVGALVLLIAYLVGGQEAIDDNWGGYIFGYAFLGSLAMSFLAFLTALFAKWRKETGKSLLLPLWFFPVYAVAVLIGEFFIFE